MYICMLCICLKVFNDGRLKVPKFSRYLLKICPKSSDEVCKVPDNLIYVPNMLKTFKIFLHFNNVEQLHLIFEH